MVLFSFVLDWWLLGCGYLIEEALDRMEAGLYLLKMITGSCVFPAVHIDPWLCIMACSFIQCMTKWLEISWRIHVRTVKLVAVLLCLAFAFPSHKICCFYFSLDVLLLFYLLRMVLIWREFLLIASSTNDDDKSWSNFSINYLLYQNRQSSLQKRTNNCDSMSIPTTYLLLSCF